MPPRRATFNVAEAKAHLPELLERAAQGEEIVLARAGKPKARLVPLDPDRKHLRKPGRGMGRFRMLRGFDDPLPARVLSLFTGVRSSARPTRTKR